MITLEWIAIGVIVAGLIVAFIFRNTPFVQKNKWYGLIVLVVLLFVIADVIRRMSGQHNEEVAKKASEDLQVKITDIKDKMTEDNNTAIIKTTAAKAKNQAVIDQLVEVKKIPDDKERRRRLAEMVG